MIFIASNTAQWKKARVRLYQENIALTGHFPFAADFLFTGKGNIRNIRFALETYRKK